jgi:hypothetical protein
MVQAASAVLDLEGVGILIPPQIEFKLNVKPMTTNSRGAANSSA